MLFFRLLPGGLPRVSHRELTKFKLEYFSVERALHLQDLLQFRLSAYTPANDTVHPSPPF